jgi:hypothetical protein
MAIKPGGFYVSVPDQNRMLHSIDDIPPAPPRRTDWPWTSPSFPAATTPPAINWPRITLVTPSYNQGAFIEQTVRSVLLQGYPNLEYIIIDGGSTDETVNIIKKYASKITFWVSEPDRGQSDAINKGLARATGEWVNWLNSDDFLLPGALFALAAAGKPDTHRILAGTTLNIRDGATFGRYATRLETGARAPFFLGVNQPGSLLRLADVRAAGGVRTDLSLCMDLDLWLRIIGAHGPDCVQSIPNEVAVYRYHAESKTCRETDPFALEEYALLFDLAVSLGARLPASLAAVRASARFPASAPSFATQSVPPTEAEAAFLSRLLVDDSLLFRALCKTNPAPASLLKNFLLMLDELHPLLVRHFPMRSTPSLRAAALVVAAQSLPRFAPRFYFEAFKSSPSLHILADALRGALRS